MSPNMTASNDKLISRNPYYSPLAKIRFCSPKHLTSEHPCIRASVHPYTTLIFYIHAEINGSGLTNICKPTAVNHNCSKTAIYWFSQFKPIRNSWNFSTDANQIRPVYSYDSHGRLRRTIRGFRVLIEPEPTLYNAGLPYTGRLPRTAV
jgi:hypothetical protein